MTMRPALFGGSLLLALCAVSGCDSPPDERSLPVPPTVVLDGFDSDVVAQVRAAEAEVVAQPRDAAANGRVAELLHAYRQYQWAAPYYQRARLLDPASFDWAYLHAVVLSELGNNDEALAAVRAAVALRADFLPANLLLAGLLAERGDSSQSRALYDAVIATDADVPQALLGRARLTDDADERIALLERAARSDAPYGEAHYALASAYRSQNRVQEADAQLALFERFRGREPGPRDALLGRVAEHNLSKQGLMKVGLELLGAGRNARAAAYLERVLEKDPTDMAAYSYLVIAYGNLGEYGKARSRYAAAIAAGETPLHLHGNMGVLELKLKRYREAQALFRKALEIDDDYALGHFYLGATLETLGEPAQALVHYQRSVALDEDNRQAGQYLGNLHRKLGNHADAIAQFERITGPDDTQSAQYLADMALACLGLRDYERAQAVVDRATAIAAAGGLSELLASLQQQSQRIQRARQRDSAASSP